MSTGTHRTGMKPPAAALHDAGVTVRRLADEAGLSMKTVGDMVSGHARVSGRVREAARRLLPKAGADRFEAESDRLWAANDKRRAAQAAAAANWRARRAG